MYINLTYILLAFTVLNGIFYPNRTVIIFGFLLSALTGLYQGIVTPIGIGLLVCFGGAAWLLNKYQPKLILLRASFLIVLLSLAAFFSFHLVPGFHNLLVFQKLQLSEKSIPFSMYLNFDKVMVALILYYFSSLPEAQKQVSFKDLRITFTILAICIISVIIPSWISGYIKPDFKITNITPIFMLNNFIFVCFAEEVMFRGILQSFLKEMFKNSQIKYLHIIITAALFGIAHVAGGFIYICLASLAGFFYGYAYERTGKLLSSMIVHFGLNFSHFILFTYPVSIAMLK